MDRPFLLFMRHLKKRAQFLKAARGKRFAGRFFVLQAVPVQEHDDAGVGFTVTKRVGNSPERSRIKRRLRAAVHTCQNQFADQYDYVLIGRRAVLNAPFTTLVEKLEHALGYLAKQQDQA
jgi:ribonuclease P protein component